MQGLDKIYIQQDMINNIPLEQKEFDDDVEFIRKDALLEWAKDKHMELDPPQNERDFGRIEAVEELIDKINSL